MPLHVGFSQQVFTSSESPFVPVSHQGPSCALLVAVGKKQLISPDFRHCPANFELELGRYLRNECKATSSGRGSTNPHHRGLGRWSSCWTITIVACRSRPFNRPSPPHWTIFPLRSPATLSFPYRCSGRFSSSSIPRNRQPAVWIWGMRWVWTRQQIARMLHRSRSPVSSAEFTHPHSSPTSLYASRWNSRSVDLLPIACFRRLQWCRTPIADM